MATHVTHRLTDRYEVAIQDPEDDWADRIWAIRDPENEKDGPIYWLLGGDNTGTGTLIVHPYHIPYLIRLLLALETEDTDATEHALIDPESLTIAVEMIQRDWTCDQMTGYELQAYKALMAARDGE